MSTCLVVICKDIGEKINCPGDFVIVYMTDFPKKACPRLRDTASYVLWARSRNLGTTFMNIHAQDIPFISTMSVQNFPDVICTELPVFRAVIF